MRVPYKQLWDFEGRALMKTSYLGLSAPKVLTLYVINSGKDYSKVFLGLPLLTRME